MEELLPVRVGTPDDIHDVMELALMACDENGFVNPETTKLLEHIWSALNQDFGLMGIIGKIGEKPEAAILLRISQMWYGNDYVLEERALFVRPEFRAAKGGRARRLAEFAKESSEALKIPLLIGVLSNHRTEGKIRMYRRIFGEPAGAFFLYGAKTGHQEAEE